MGRCRLQLSTTVMIRNGRLLAKMAYTKSMPQRSEDRSGSGQATDAMQYVSAFELASATEAHRDDSKWRTRLRSPTSLRATIPKSADIQTAGGPQTFFARPPTASVYGARDRPSAASISCSLLPIAATAASSLTPDARTSSSRRKAYPAMPSCRQKSLRGGDVMFVLERFFISAEPQSRQKQELIRLP
jgi:hypothetical protein